MVKLRVSYILQASAIATLAIAFSGVAYAADTSEASARTQLTQTSENHTIVSNQSSEKLSSSDSPRVEVEVSANATQSAGSQQVDSHQTLASTTKTGDGKGFDSDAKLRSISSTQDATTLSARTLDATASQAAKTETTAVELKQAKLAEQSLEGSLSPVKQFFVSQLQIDSVAAQSTVSVAPTSSSAVQGTATANSHAPAPTGAEIPSLPGSIAQRLSSVLSTYATNFLLAPISATSSTFPAILSLLVATGLFGLVFVGSLYLKHLRAAGFLAAGRAVPSLSFVTDHMMSLTRAINVLASSFFNRQNTQISNLMHT